MNCQLNWFRSRRTVEPNSLVYWMTRVNPVVHVVDPLEAVTRTFETRVGGGREGARLVSLAGSAACVNFTPNINSWLISTHFRRLRRGMQCLSQRLSTFVPKCLHY